MMTTPAELQALALLVNRGQDRYNQAETLWLNEIFSKLGAAVEAQSAPAAEMPNPQQERAQGEQ